MKLFHINLSSFDFRIPAPGEWPQCACVVKYLPIGSTTKILSETQPHKCRLEIILLPPTSSDLFSFYLTKFNLFKLKQESFNALKPISWTLCSHSLTLHTQSTPNGPISYSINCAKVIIVQMNFLWILQFFESFHEILKDNF